MSPQNVIDVRGCLGQLGLKLTRGKVFTVLLAGPFAQNRYRPEPALQVGLSPYGVAETPPRPFYSRCCHNLPPPTLVVGRHRHILSLSVVVGITAYILSICLLRIIVFK